MRGKEEDGMALPKEEQQTAEQLYRAFIYAYPLVYLSVQIDAVTNTEYPTAYKAPVNQLIHAKGLADENDKYISVSNIDTVYSQIYFDLKREPVYLYKPKTDRYTIAEIIDAYGDYVDILGTGATGGNEEVHAVLAGPDFKGEIPENYTVVRMPTNIGWTLIRVLQKDEADLENVREIQRQFQVRPFRAVDLEYKQPKGTYHPEFDYIPLERMNGIDIETFFNTFNRLVADNPGKHPDADLLKSVEPYGIGEGKVFSLNRFSPDLQKELKGFVSRAVATFTDEVNEDKLGEFVNGWVLPDERLADYGNDYDFRANTIWRGVGANPIWMCFGPCAANDGEGRRLDSKNDYVVHFDTLPPVDGFWSVTIYGEDRYLIQNEIRRYGINDRSPFRLNEDGSLDIYVQRKQPGAEWFENWLPSGEQGFLLVLRLYLPRKEILNKTWTFPKIKRVNEEEEQTL